MKKSFPYIHGHKLDRAELKNVIIQQPISPSDLLPKSQKVAILDRQKPQKDTKLEHLVQMRALEVSHIINYPKKCQKVEFWSFYLLWC